MASEEGQGGLKSVLEGWSKWQIGLAVGAPIALGLAGIWYYRRSKQLENPEKKKTKTDDRKGKTTKFEPVPSPLQEELSPLNKAQSAKDKGNKHFKDGKYDEAINCYNMAIDLCPPENHQDLSTFYQNRAAAYEHLKNFEKVVEDCTQALKYNAKYVKALTRRSKACEQIGDLTTALEDVTAVCILEGFQNQMTLQMADRVLKDLGKKKAQEAFQKRKPTMPSQQFVKSYLASFTQDPILCKLSENADTTHAQSNEPEMQSEQAENEQQEVAVNHNHKEESSYDTALEKIKQQEYSEVISLCTAHLDQGLENPHFTEATLLRGTFLFLKGELDKALEDFNLILDKNDLEKKMKVNALIKRGSLFIQQEKKKEGLDDFMMAEDTDSDNSDVYHHRGHQCLQMDDLDDAIKNFDTSISKNPDFAISHVQKSYAEHRKAAMLQSPSQLNEAIKSYEATVQKFPKCADAHALYAQALCDLGRFDDADEEFQKAMKLEPDNATVFVHRGLLKLQWKQNVDEAVKMINQAIALDDKCEYAYEVLGTLEVQRGDMDKAVEHFNKAINLCRMETEMSHLYSLLNAAQAQLKVAKNLGIQIPMGIPPM
ncbi:hypothetical protein CHS0354_019163 [Potamilus streckersoni]|uniref:Mitochondrial import receptor subunit TOM70 n=1 Tax=Potamilus streckersoni TaxID=2493646 RepID=A0AAE0SZY7_9BIVA|nr:hypothetical protein CHS0354_019163 [Potamilus streckersoni]